MSGQTGGSSAPAAADAASPDVIPDPGVRPESVGAGTVLAAADGALLAGYAARIVAATLAAAPLDGRPPRVPALRALGASFVTLQRCGELRGCIGSLEAVRPLYLDVARNAARAMADPRLAPVGPDDWPELDVGVSVLGPQRPMRAAGLDELRHGLRPGVDGLVIASGSRRATFLPTVWEKLPDPTAFISALLAKGGWGRDRLPPAAEISTYEVAEFHDPAPTGGRARPGAAPR
jgi:AmmeMemoRadiSam system protein A